MHTDKLINRDDDAFSYIASLFKRIPSRFWFALAGTFIFGLAAHMYMFTNMLLVHDSVLHVRFDELYVDIMMGRLGDTLVRFLRGFMSVPWLLGLISLLCFSVSSYVVCLTLNIKRPTVVVTLSAIMVTFPAVAMGNCYVFNIDVFAAYIMLSCLSVYVANKSKCGFLFGTIILVAALLVYQAALSVAASLCLLSLMMSVLNKDESIKSAFSKALRFLFMLIVGTLIYYAIWMISVKTFDMQLPVYQNMNQVGQFSSIGSFLALIIKACRESILFFLKPYRYGYYPIFLYIATLIGIVATCYRAIAVIVEMPSMREKLCRIALLIVLCVFLCLSMDVMLVMTNGAPTHFLQRYAFVSPWLLMLAVGEVSRRTQMTEKRAVKLAASFAVLICCVCSIYNGVYGANVTYLNTQMKYDSAVSTVTRIIDKIEQTDNYTYDTPVIIVGTSIGENGHEGFEWCKRSPAVGHPSALTYNENMRMFIKNVCPDINALSGVDYADLPEVKAMPAFPHDGYIKWLGDELIVKLQ